MQGWLTLQGSAFRAAVQVVAIDPSAPYAAGIRRALPHAWFVLDHFHLVMLANQALTDVRQRVQREQHARLTHRGPQARFGLRRTGGCCCAPGTR